MGCCPRGAGRSRACGLSTATASGAGRRYFATRAHALWFLQQVAPTKAVDGAWLHGTLRHWRDPRFHGLIRTYLEELGDGDPRCNHVLIYQRLLSHLGCLQGLPLPPNVTCKVPCSSPWASTANASCPK